MDNQTKSILLLMMDRVPGLSKSDKEKVGWLLNCVTVGSDAIRMAQKISELPPRLKAIAEGFIQGLTAASADSKPALEDTRASEAGKEAQKDG